MHKNSNFKITVKQYSKIEDQGRGILTANYA